MLTFKHVGRGLQCKTDVVSGFFMCGKDAAFRLAQARITGPEQLTVWCDEIETPAAVRYAWLCDPRSVMSLYNSAGLPASPFRTDAYLDAAPLDRLLPEAQPAISPRRKGRAKLPGKIIDGSGVPHVEAPVGDFFGVMHGVHFYPINTPWLSVKQYSGYNCYFHRSRRECA